MRTWQPFAELSTEERSKLDLPSQTPRHPQFSYLPAELYPFTAPYTAEELRLRAMAFPHVARWNHVQIEDFGSIVPTGYLFSGKVIILAVHNDPEGLLGYLQTKLGDIFMRWLSQDTAPPENLGNRMLMLHHRTDLQAQTKTDLFGYSPVLRRVRRFPQPRRQDRFLDQPIPFDDFLEEAFLRPHLDRDKFLDERKLTLAPDVEARVQAQDAAGQLVFTVSEANAQGQAAEV